MQKRSRTVQKEKKKKKTKKSSCTLDKKTQKRRKLGEEETKEEFQWRGQGDKMPLCRLISATLHTFAFSDANKATQFPLTFSFSFSANLSPVDGYIRQQKGDKRGKKADLKLLVIDSLPPATPAAAADICIEKKVKTRVEK